MLPGTTTTTTTLGSERGRLYSAHTTTIKVLTASGLRRPVIRQSSWDYLRLLLQQNWCRRRSLEGASSALCSSLASDFGLPLAVSNVRLSTLEESRTSAKWTAAGGLASNFEEKVRLNLIETSWQTTVRHFFIGSIESLWKIQWNCHWQNSESFFIVRLEIRHSKQAGGRQRPRRLVIQHILIPAK